MTTTDSRSSAMPPACPSQSAARRLRMVQISFADEPAKQRCRYLAEELETLLQTVPFEQRATFLDEIEDLFPVFDNASSAPTSQAAPAVNNAAPERHEETTRELIQQLAERMDGMNEAEREDARRQMADARLIPPTSTSPSATVPSDAIQESFNYIASALKIERLDPARMARMLVMLSVHMGQIDDVIWSAWKAIAPEADLRRSTSLDEALRRYISADRSLSGVSLNTQIETTRRLLAAIVAGVGQLGIQLARQHLAPLTPQEIQLAARKGGLLGSQDAACWARYQSLARQLEEGIVDHTVKTLLAQYAEDIMKRQATAGRAPTSTRERTSHGNHA